MAVHAESRKVYASTARHASSWHTRFLHKQMMACPHCKKNGSVRSELNVNFPTGVTSDTQFAFARIGTFQLYVLKFRTTAPWGLSFGFNDPSTATPEQAQDEAVVSTTSVSVSAMQVGFEQDDKVQRWLQKELRDLFR